ncbi:exo-beta-N-acetylmuramidase NamZ family protein [Emticicia fontis]
MIQFGIDILLRQNPHWKSKNIGLVTNHAATTNNLQPSRQALLENGFNIVKLFSPEHGLDTTGADGAKMYDSIDPLTQLPVISLYGEKLIANEQDLADIDILLFDIPDIGCRFYTYLWTLSYVLEACGKFNKCLIIADRPNPISANLDRAEGVMLDESHCSSFIGRWGIPLRHSCTLGELAMYFNESKGINANIEVIRCENWQRNTYQPDWEIPFVPTSPAMRGFQSSLLYPGLGLLEATNISEGRGTEMPFTIIGAPWLNNNLLSEKLFNSKLEMQPITFVPTESKYESEVCSGINFHVKDFAGFNTLINGLMLIKLIKDQHPEYFAWKPYPTNVNPTGTKHLDLLLGIPYSESLFELPLKDFEEEIKSITLAKNWKGNIQPYLLYS